jgi:hypothetical protein
MPSLYACKDVCVPLPVQSDMSMGYLLLLESSVPEDDVPNLLMAYLYEEVLAPWVLVNRKLGGPVRFRHLTQFGSGASETYYWRGDWLQTPIATA